MKTILIIIVFLSTLGCVSRNTTLYSSYDPQTYNCKTSGWGWIGAPMAIVQHNKCVEDMKAKGYHPID